ncbi:MAG: hypothetical protein JWL72_1074 [Ilumatobacteraceae bacterium]|nr:hypothetical protein [Ilumatobacteraceae bacterium]
MNDDLRSIGDALEIAIAREIAATARNNVVALRHDSVEHTDSSKEAPVSNPTPVSITAARKRRLSRRSVVAIAVLGTLAVGGAAAATAIHLSDDEVSNGLPGGSAIFEGTHPTCTNSGDGVVYDCTLASAPTAEVLSDYVGTLELFVDSAKNIAGGCRGITADGLQWTCYVGDRAVQEGILSSDLLGQYSPEPGRG